MSTTTAVTLDHLARSNGSLTGQPFCPACKRGYLHPYKVQISLGPLPHHGATGLEGWVAVCEGNEQYIRAWNTEWPDEPYDGPEFTSCGFSMPLQPV